MGAAKLVRITVEVPTDLLKRARRATGKGEKATIVEAFRAVAEAGETEKAWLARQAKKRRATARPKRA